MIKKCSIFCIALLLSACQQISPLNNNQIKENNFKTKTTSSDDLGFSYTGSWLYNSPTLEPLWQLPSTDVKSGFEDLTDGIAAETSVETNALTGSGWQSIQSSPSYYLTLGHPQENIQENSPNIYYSSNFDSGTDYKYKSGNGNIIPDNTITYSGSGWVAKSNYKYNFNKNKDTSINFNFYGTNLEIEGMKGKDAGWNNLKITIKDQNNNIIQATGYDSQENLVDLNNINTYSETNGLAKIVKIKGLVLGNYSVKIESADISRSQGKVSFLYGFSKATVYPSLQYTFNDNSIVYNALSDSNAGKVDIIVKENNNVVDKQIVDLYNSSPVNTIKYSKIFNNLSTKTITIEARGESSSNNTANNINIDFFARRPYLDGLFTGNKLVLRYLKNTMYGNLSLFVDNVFKQTINQNNSSLISEEIVIDIGGTSTTNHSFRLVSENFANIVGYSGNNHKASISIYKGFDGNLQFNAKRGPKKGKVKLTFASYGASDIVYEINLYSPSSSEIPYSEKTFPISLGQTEITIEPTYTKAPESSGYMIDFQSLRYQAVTNSNFTNGLNVSDTICTP